MGRPRRGTVATAGHRHRPPLAVCLALLATMVVQGQERATLYVFVADRTGTPVLELDPSNIQVREDAGPSRVLSVRRFGWPLKITVLIDNGPRTAEGLVHYRNGLTKFFAGLPPGVPVSLITTAPQPRWLFRETTDRVQIQKGIGRLTPDEGLGRFSDALIEYAERLDREFRNLSREEMPPYLPVLVSIATTHQDGSEVNRERNLRMLTSLRQHLVSTTMIMVAYGRAAAEPGGAPAVEFNEGQNAEIAKAVQEVTRGRYVPVTGSGTGGLVTSILPELAQTLSLRYLKQMTQHRVEVERAAGARGPMTNFAMTLLNHPDARLLVSADGSMP